MQNIIKYLIHSNLTIAFNLNPLRWGFTLDHFGPNDEGGNLQPKTHFLYVKFFCFVVMLIVTDGEL